MLTQRFCDAAALAVAAHDGQRRKSTDIPYASHVLSVAALVLEFGGDEDQAIAGLLHDVLEDCDPPFGARIGPEFGPRVLAMVEGCTDGEPGGDRGAASWQQRKDAYLAHLEIAPAETLLVSACDKLHNARSIARDYARLGDGVFDRFNAGKDKTLWYYRALYQLFAQRLPGHEVVSELGYTLARFGAL